MKKVNVKKGLYFIDRVFSFLEDHLMVPLITLVLIVVFSSIVFSTIVILDPTDFPWATRARETVLAISTATMVFATLLLALGTFRLIRKDREKESRDRKERYLNEIIQWLNDVITRPLDIGVLTGSRYTQNRNIIWILHALGDKGIYIKKLASSIFGNPLTDSIAATRDAIGMYAETMLYFIERKFEILGMPDDGIDRITKELDEAIAEDNRSAARGIPSTKMQDAIERNRAESKRDKALIALDICVSLKADLLIK